MKRIGVLQFGGNFDDEGFLHFFIFRCKVKNGEDFSAQLRLAMLTRQRTNTIASDDRGEIMNYFEM